MPVAMLFRLTPRHGRSPTPKLFVSGFAVSGQSKSIIRLQQIRLQKFFALHPLVSIYPLAIRSLVSKK
jgi:hypothetical protein